ncbi:MAG: hypothetical protein HWQ38_08135 [Nostoc sp. NMS7]|uniref:hypothetical protein n=1 Tax=Nostoc sp. NMS7 TaxID=2815391 RepID=UPI0025D13422|nr:hypothetical protein [Nostoc sp. NMS7]MBN3946451.1 hypothetical protein [Nostoc sp. NMS7]
MPASSNTVQIIIEAKDAASDVIKSTGLAFEGLNKSSTNLSKSLLNTSTSLQSTANYTDATKNKIAELVPVVTAYGAAMTAVLASVVTIFSKDTTSAVIDKTGVVFDALVQKSKQLSDALLLTENSLQSTGNYAEIASAKIAEIVPIIDKYKDTIISTLSSVNASFSQGLKSEPIANLKVEISNLSNKTIELNQSLSITDKFFESTGKYADAVKSKIAELSPVINEYSAIAKSALAESLKTVSTPNEIREIAKSVNTKTISKGDSEVKTGNVSGSLSKEATTLNEVLSNTNKTFQSTVKYADEAKNKIVEIGPSAITSGAAIAVTTAGAIAGFYGLNSVIGQVKQVVGTPIAGNLIQGIGQQAIAATKELAPVKDLVTEIGSVAGSLGSGFTQKLFNLDTRSIGEQLNAGINLGVKNLADKVRNPLKEALGTFSNLDELSPEQLKQRRLNAQIANVSKTSGYSNANAPGGAKVFDQIDKTLALIYADRKIGEKLGQNLSTDLVKGFISNTPAKNLLSAPIQELINGSLTNAILKIPQQKLSASFGSILGTASTGANAIASKAGESLANKVFGGFEAEAKKSAGKDLIGNTFQGVGKKFTDEVGIGTKTPLPLPIIGNLRENAAPQVVAEAARVAVNFVLPEPLALVNELIDYDAAVEKLFDTVGIKGEIPGLKKLDAALGKAVSAGLGKGIDSGISNVLAPLIDNALDYVTKEFRTAGANAIASAASAFLPEYLKNVVKSSLLQSGTAGLIFDTLIDNLKPEKLLSNFSALDGVLENLETNVNSALTLVNSLLERLKTSIAGGIPGIANIIPSLKSGITEIFDFLTNGVTQVESVIQKLLISVFDGIELIKSLIPSLIGGVSNSIDIIQSSLSKSFVFIDNFLNELKAPGNFGQEYTVQIEFIQKQFVSLQSIAATTLSFIQEKVLVSTNSFVDFGNALQKAIVSISSFTSSVSNNIKNQIGQSLTSVIADIDRNAPNLAATFNNLIDGAIAGVGANGQGGFGKIFNGMIDNAKETIATVTPILTEFFASTESRFVQFVGQARQILGSIAGVLAQSLGKVVAFLLEDETQDFFKELSPEIKSAIQGIFGNTFSDLIGSVGANAAKSFIGGFIGAGIERIVPLINTVDAALLTVFDTLSSLPSKISEPLSQAAKIPAFLGEIDQPLVAFGKVNSLIETVTGSIVSATQSLGLFGQGISALQSASAAPFEFLIAQTVELREQLLSTQASLVATSNITNNLTGKQATDPTTAIQSLELPIKNAIADLRAGSLGLAGVTSGDLVPLFQQIAGEITAIGGNLTNAKDLSLDFAAALGTLNIPLSESRTEIGSILNGTISVETKLAQVLNISNAQVANWKSQGRLVTELQKRLEPFRAGNALAADAFSGVTSNVKEIYKEVGRQSGEKLLDPLLKQITEIYDYLKVNETEIISYFSVITDQILRMGLAVADAGKIVFSSIGGFAAEIPLYLFTTLANVVEAVGEAIKFTSEVLSPAIHFITELATFVRPLASEFLQMFVSMTVLSSAISVLGSAFGSVTRLVPGLNNVIYALDIRTNGVANQFINLTKVLGTGGGGFLILGKYLNSIPGASEAASLALGPLGGTLVGFIPTLADIGIQVAGLIILFPALGVFLSGLISALPTFITFVGTLASQNIFLAPLTPLFIKAAAGAELYADASTRGAVITAQFSGILKEVGRSIAGQILSFGILAGGAYLAFLAFDHFILQNQAFKEILESVVQGLGVLGEGIKIVFGSILGNAIVVATAFGIAVRLKLLLPITELIASTLAGWAIGVAGAIGGLATTLSALGLVEMAASASTAAVGFKALGIAMTEGTVKAAGFLATNGIVVTELFGVTAATGGATVGVATFATALYSAIAPLLLLLAPLALFGALLAGLAFAAYTVKLNGSREATEILTEQTQRLSERSLKVASELKKAGDVQAEANKRAVRLSDEQYKANEKLVNQAKGQRADLAQEVVELQSQLKDAVGDAEKAKREQLIADIQSKIKLLDSLVGNVQIKPVDLIRYGSAYEQLANLATAAEQAILKSSGDPAAFKQKAEELISSTQKQSEVGEISAEEAIRRYNLVATNANATSDIQQKAQEAITATFKRESDNRVAIVQAEQAAISAQLALGRVEYENNAAAIAEVQNSALKSRLDAEKDAHEVKMKQIQDEFDNQVFVNTSLLNQKEAAANIEAQRTADREAFLQGFTKAELGRVKAAIAANQSSDPNSRNAFQELAFIEKQNDLKEQQKQLELEIEASKVRQAENQKTAKDKPLDVDLEARKTLKEKIVQIEKDKTAALTSEQVRNARITSELTNQVAKNETDAAKLAADLRIKVKSGAISQELAAERQLTFAKKIELETQLRNVNDTYAESKKEIVRSYADTTKNLEDDNVKKQKIISTSPKDSDAFKSATADLTLNNTKIVNANKAKNKELALLEQKHGVEVSKINSDTLKNQAESEEKESSIPLKILERNQKKALDAVQAAQDARLGQVQQLENKGLLTHTQAEEEKTKATRINTAAQLNEERLRLKALQALPRPKNQEKAADFDATIRASQLKVQGLVKSSLDAELNLYHQHIATILENVKDEDTIRETQLENQSRRGLVSQNQVAEELARRKIVSLEKDYALETKDASKRKDLALQIEKAKTDLQNKHIATVIGDIKDEDTVREAQLESQARRGLIVQSQVNEELARRKVATLEKELALETSNLSKRKDLALQIEKAKTALLDAEIKTRQEKLELQNQKLKNQIDEQNQGLKRQGDLYAILVKALEQRNKLQEIAKDLNKTGTDYVVGELDVLSSIETSEYRKKELAEITASIKLRSLTLQQKFERESLANQFKLQELALEQEAIQNRIAQGNKVSDIAGTKADIAIAEADPRNKSEAGQAKIKALQLKLNSEYDVLGNLQDEAGLIGQKAVVQHASEKAQLAQLGMKQSLEEIKAEGDYANTLPPGKKQQAGRAIEQKVAQLFGQKNIQDLLNAGIADSRKLANNVFGTPNSPDILGAINPQLGGILDEVGANSQAGRAAIADTQQTFNKQYGNTQNITGAFTTGIAKTPFQLPLEVQRSQALSNQILKQANQPDGTDPRNKSILERNSQAETSFQARMDKFLGLQPEDKLKTGNLPDSSLKLPSPTERGSLLSLENSGKLFGEAIDKLLTYLKDQSSTSKKGGTSYNIKVEGGQKTATATGSGSDSSLENVLLFAKQMASA